jgi:hypothetical protein
MAKQANAGSFKPGVSGNPKGMAKGTKHAVPSVREIVNAVVSENLDDVKRAYRESAVRAKSVLQALELKARVNREVGQGAAATFEQDSDGTIRCTLTWPENAA